MTQREQIKALQDEIAELRKQLSALSAAMAELATKQPPYAPSQPMLPWQTPYVGGINSSASRPLSEYTVLSTAGGVYYS